LPKASRQGDQMSLWKIRPKCSPTHFCEIHKNITYTAENKSLQIYKCYFWKFSRTFRVNNRPIGKKSPNLATLLPGQALYVCMYVCMYMRTHGFQSYLRSNADNKCRQFLIARRQQQQQNGRDYFWIFFLTVITSEYFLTVDRCTADRKSAWHPTPAPLPELPNFSWYSIQKRKNIPNYRTLYQKYI
jgi:hypothetical protein